MGQENLDQCMTDPKEVLENVEGCFALLKETIDSNKYYISIGATTIVVFMVCLNFFRRGIPSPNCAYKSTLIINIINLTFFYF